MNNKMSRMLYFCEGLPPEIVKRAEVELGETEEVRTQSLKEIRRLIKEEPDFQPRNEDAFLLRFLRTKKFNVEKAFKTLKTYYIFKAKYHRILMDFTPSEAKHLLDKQQGMMLEYRDDDHVGVALLRIGQFDIDKYSPEEILGHALTCTEVGLQPEVTSVVGYSFIFDFADFNLRMIKHYASPTFLYRLVHAIQDCMPCRIKAYHFVNEPVYFKLLLNVLRNFMTEKLSKRVYIHGSNLKSLHEHVPPDILPEELGGNQGPLHISAKKYNEYILSKEEYIKSTIKYGYQGKTLEKLRKEVSKDLLT